MKNNLRRYSVNKEINTMLKGLIHKKQRAMKYGECDYEDLLDLILSSNQYAQTMKDANTKGMTIDEVIEECKLF